MTLRWLRLHHWRQASTPCDRMGRGFVATKSTVLYETESGLQALEPRLGLF